MCTHLFLMQSPPMSVVMISEMFLYIWKQTATRGVRSVEYVEGTFLKIHISNMWPTSRYCFYLLRTLVNFSWSFCEKQFVQQTRSSRFMRHIVNQQYTLSITEYCSHYFASWCLHLWGLGEMKSPLRLVVWSQVKVVYPHPMACC